MQLLFWLFSFPSNFSFSSYCFSFFIWFWRLASTFSLILFLDSDFCNWHFTSVKPFVTWIISTSFEFTLRFNSLTSFLNSSIYFLNSEFGIFTFLSSYMIMSFDSNFSLISKSFSFISSILFYSCCFSIFRSEMFFYNCYFSSFQA